MSDARKGQVNTSAAEIYDEFFVPALFAQWAGPVADAAGVAAGERVLDVACGTGVLTRAVAERASPGGSVAGVDVNQGMLAVAKRHIPDADWHQAPAEALPFPDADFDRVVCQFGLMFFEDRPSAAREMLRVLRPGGTLAVAVWAPLQDSPGYLDMTRLLERLFGRKVADALRAPFCMSDPVAVRQLFATAGASDVQVRTLKGKARFPSLDAWIHTDVKGWTLDDLIDDAQFERLRHEALRTLTHYVGPDQTVVFDAPAHVLTAAKL